MERHMYAVGIYVADDYIWFSAVPDNANELIAPSFASMTPPGSVPCTDDFENDMREVISCIVSDAIKLGYTIEFITVAIPGPILSSGIRIKSSRSFRYGMVGEICRVPALRNMNIMRITRSIISSRPKLFPFVHRYRVFVYQDAAAYAMGDFTIRMHKYIDKAKIGKTHDLAQAINTFKFENIFAHVLVDEGIGGAFVINGNIGQGPVHAEMGHIIVQRHSIDTGFDGCCPTHWRREGCLEGLVGLPALRKRFGSDFLESYPKWTGDDFRIYLIAYYLAQLATSLVLMTAPTKIAFGGRVITENKEVISRIRTHVREMLELEPESDAYYPGYMEQHDIDFIDVTKDKHAGVYGCALLARWMAHPVRQENVTSLFSR